MAHYARLNADNVVTHVTPLADSVSLDADGNDDEAASIAYLEGLFPDSTDTWVRTSYNNNIGGHFAAIDDTWNGEIFVAPAGDYPDSWVLNAETGMLDPPVPYVSGYVWNSETDAWDQPPQPDDLPSFTWQTTWQADGRERPNGCWSPPVAHPGTYIYTDDGARIYTEPYFKWDEATLAWLEET